MKSLTFFLFGLMFFNFSTIAQQDSLNHKRLNTVIIGESVLYIGSTYFLANSWYKNQEHSSFHFFNDNAEWLQMDKAGHFVTSFYIGSIGIDALRWTGIDDKKAIWYGGSLGLVYLTSIEIFDGFSGGYGASLGDMTANILGSSAVIAQELIWGERKILFKYSYSPSKFAQYRPELLGNNNTEQWLKDYNGQTYWLSTGLSNFSSIFDPIPFVCISFGYGANGMTGGSNNVRITEENRIIPIFERYRQYYLSLDIDFTRIKTRSKFLKTVFNTINFVKIPFPALEYNSQDGFKTHAVFF